MSTVWGSTSNIPQSPLTSLNTVTREPNNDLDRQAFLQLLVTQLRYQDPLNPMEDREFIAQMAQFSALEQMINLNQTFERNHAFSTLGRSVDAAFVHPVTGEWTEISGLVTAVNTQGNQVLLVVNGIDVPFDAVKSISEDFFVSHQLDAIFQHILSQEANNLVGMYVQAITVNGDNQEFVEGRVTQVRMNPQTGQIILTVGTRDVFRHEVTGIAGEPQLINVPGFVFGNRTPTNTLEDVLVTRIDIVGNRAYLVFNINDTQGQPLRQHIERINYATEALRFVGQEISHAGISGRVGSISIQAGVPHFNVYEYTNGVRGDFQGAISYLNYLADRMGVAPPSTP